MALDPSGNFVVVWQWGRTPPYPGPDPSWRDVYGQRYSSTGEPLGHEFRVNTYATRFQLFPAVASDASGNFIVVWMSNRQDGLGSGIFGQRYSGIGRVE